MAEIAIFSNCLPGRLQEKCRKFEFDRTRNEEIVKN